MNRSCLFVEFCFCAYPKKNKSLFHPGFLEPAFLICEINKKSLQKPVIMVY